VGIFRIRLSCWQLAPFPGSRRDAVSQAPHMLWIGRCTLLQALTVFARLPLRAFPSGSEKLSEKRDFEPVVASSVSTATMGRTEAFSY